MAYKKIVIFFDGYKTNALSDFSALIGRAFLGRLAGCYAHEDITRSIPFLGEGMAVSMIEDFVKVASTETLKLKNKVKDDFCKTLASHGIFFDESEVTKTNSAFWVDVDGPLVDVVKNVGLLADLIVIAQPSIENDFFSNSLIRTALFETSQPVLVVPRTCNASTLPKNVLVYWNGSQEGARTIGYSLPLLRQAENIYVLSRSSGELSGNVGSDLINYFLCHEICVTETFNCESKKSVGAEVVERSEETHSDLIVLGAFTQSRLRKMVLGSVTNHLIENSRVPIFLTH